MHQAEERQSMILKEANEETDELYKELRGRSAQLSATTRQLHELQQRWQRQLSAGQLLGLFSAAE